MALIYVDQAQLEGKKVLARFDFNVPLDKTDKNKILDSTRIDLALPTIKHILESGAKKLVLMSHLGRPKGQTNLDYSLEPVATDLAQKLSEDVILTESPTDRGIKSLLNLPTTKIVLLENLRFNPGEEKNDPELARTLASYGEVYINDAFGTAHRKHASTYGIVAHFPKKSYGGFLLKKEIEALNNVIEQPKKPFVAVVGGAKISDKIKIVEKLLSSVDQLLIGGAMAYAFLKAKGHEVGKSLCADEDVSLAKKVLKNSYASKLILPLDHIASDSIDGSPREIDKMDIPSNLMGLDIGPKTLAQYKSILAQAKTVLWNGPMGLAENPSFANGTNSIATTLAQLSDSFTLVGGGDSVSAVNKTGVGDKLSHVSTGGGASLEYIEEGTLPGVNALKFGINYTKPV